MAQSEVQSSKPKKAAAAKAPKKVVAPKAEAKAKNKPVKASAPKNPKAAPVAKKATQAQQPPKAAALPPPPPSSARREAAPIAKPQRLFHEKKQYPEQFSSFAECQLDPALQQTLDKNNFGKPNPFQRDLLAQALNNKSLIATSGSGSGKLAAYMIFIAEKILSQQFPKGADNEGPSVLVVVSTRDQIGKVQSGCQRQLAPVQVSHAVISNEIPSAKVPSLLESKPDVVVASLEKTLEILDQKLINPQNLKCVIFDEVDEALQGHPEKLYYAENLLPRLLPLDAQIILIEAMYCKKLTLQLEKIFHRKNFKHIHGNIFGYDHLQNTLYAVPAEQKFNVLLGLLQKNNQPTIIFANTKLVGEWVLYKLIGNNIKADIFWPHRDDERVNTIGIEKLKKNEIQVLIAGDEFSKQINVPDLERIINFDVPDMAKGYLERVKRLVKSNKPVQSVMLICEDYGYNMSKLEERLKIGSVLSPLPAEFLNTKDASDSPIDENGRVKRVRFGAQQAEGTPRPVQQQQQQTHPQQRPATAPQQGAGASSASQPQQPYQQQQRPTRPQQDDRMGDRGGFQQQQQPQQQRPQRPSYGDTRAKEAAAGIVEAAARAAAAKQTEQSTQPRASSSLPENLSDGDVARVLDALEVKVDQIFDSIKKSVFGMLRSSLPFISELSKKVGKD